MRLSSIAAITAAAWVSPILPAYGRAQEPSQGTTEFNAFREALRARERILKSSRIEFRQLTFPDLELAPAKAVVGYVLFTDGFEKWVRWEHIREEAVDPKIPLPDEFWNGLSKGRPPRIDTADGSRSVSFVPEEKQPGTWRGMLRVALDSKIRIGAINCTIMFGERWLSDYCSRYKLAGFQSAQSGPEFTLVPDTNVPNTDSVKIHTDAHNTPTRIVWSKGGVIAVEAVVLEMVTFEGQQFPARGEIHHHYTPDTTNLVSFRYEHLDSGALGSSLLTMPSEITSAGGTVNLTDELTRKPIPIGGSTKPADQAPPPVKHEEVEGSLPTVLLVGLTGAALLCALLVGIRSWKGARA